MWFGLAGRAADADEGSSSSSSSDSESVGRSPTCAGPFLRFARAAAFFAFAAARRASRVTSSDALVGWAPLLAVGAASSLSSELSSSDEDSSLDEGISSPGSCCIRMACQFFSCSFHCACAREVAGGERGGELVFFQFHWSFNLRARDRLGYPPYRWAVGHD